MTGRLRLGYLSLVMSALLFGGATPLAVYALRGLTAFDLLAVEIGQALRRAKEKRDAVVAFYETGDANNLISGKL